MPFWRPGEGAISAHCSNQRGSAAFLEYDQGWLLG